MGIIVEVNRLEADGLAYVEVVVEAYPYPISYRGHYYQRSGATNQELKGAALDRFMLRRQGKTWDGVPVPYLTVDDLDSTTFQSDRQYASDSKRWCPSRRLDSGYIVVLPSQYALQSRHSQHVLPCRRSGGVGQRH